MNKKINITRANKMFAFAKLDFTHDYSGVKVGTIMINRDGEFSRVTKIDKDDCGRLCYWSKKVCLCTQYQPSHNMMTKPPYFAYQFKTK